LNEDRGSRYHRQRRQAAVASLALTAALLIALVVSGASVALRDWALWSAGAAPAGLPRHLLAASFFVLALYVLEEIVSLPLAIYRGYLLEQRYGLSRETFGVWLRDHVKASLIGLLFALIAAIAVYTAIAVAPSWWWVGAAAMAAFAAVLLTIILPTVLLPLFYRLEPLDRPELRDRLIALARAHRVRTLGVYVWGLGEKTRKANAALVGLRGTRRILLSDTLLADYSDDEIEVILAHELAHHVHHDIRKAIAFEAVVAAGAAYCADLAVRAMGPSVGIGPAGDLAALPLLLLGAGAASVISVPLANALSRRNERLADRFALQITRQPAAFISAMRRLGAQNLAEERPSAIARMLFYTHPPVDERIAFARTFPPG
jgi:STE24 endopeptidase